MSDPFQAYEAVHRLVERTRADPMEMVKVGLLIAVLVVVCWRLIFAWLNGTISGTEALAVIVSLLVAEMAAVRWLPDFHGVRLVLFLALPVAVWVGIQIMAGVVRRESYRSNVNADVRRLRAAVRRDARNAAAHELLGDAYRKLGRPRRAVAEYQVAVALEPDYHKTVSPCRC